MLFITAHLAVPRHPSHRLKTDPSGRVALTRAAGKLAIGGILAQLNGTPGTFAIARLLRGRGSGIDTRLGSAVRIRREWIPPGSGWDLLIYHWGLGISNAFRWGVLL